MRPPYFTVLGDCPRCFGPDHFTVQRKKIKKVSTDGHEYTIKNIVCPRCRMWCDVVGIKEITK